MNVSVTRRYRFSASHRLHLRSLTEDQNRALYGKCNYPYGHGHDYILEVTYAGPLNERTGLVAPPAHLDRLVQSKVLDLFAGKNINLDIPDFSEKVPTTENISLVIAGILQRHWHEFLPEAQLRRVHVQETDRNGFEVLLPAHTPREQRSAEREVISHA